MVRSYHTDEARPVCPIAFTAVVSCLGVVAKTYLIPNDWTVGNDLLCHTLGAVRIPHCTVSRLLTHVSSQLLIGLHIWASMESYEVLGVFGV
jgi:phosphatidylethanolamine N-methyltransferase